jgi:2-oxoglutarate ferredoxin oxidoreductase subunit delta
MTRRSTRGGIVIDPQRCKGCGLCIRACPKGHILLNERVDQLGIRVACFDDEHKCNGCAFCAMICPDVAIRVFREVSSKSDVRGSPSGDSNEPQWPDHE